MEWYWLVIYLALGFFNAWMTGRMVEQKKYSKAFFNGALCFYFLSIVIIQTAPTTVIHIN